jgi:hypothetical protein
MIQDKLEKIRKVKGELETQNFNLTRDLLDCVFNQVEVGSYYKSSNIDKEAIFKVISKDSDWSALEVELVFVESFNHSARFYHNIYYDTTTSLKYSHILGELVKIDEEIFNSYKQKCFAFNRF